MTNEEYVKKVVRESIPSRYTGLTPEHLRMIRDHYDRLNKSIVEMQKNTLKYKIRRGEEVSEEELRLAKITRHDLEMEVKLDMIREDPVQYYANVRKKYRKEEEHKIWRETFRPISRLFDWLRGRR